MIGVSFSGCQGWFHPAPGRRAVLLCSPQGFEELTARRTWRVLANKIAAAGYPVLRFDYPGTADSLGDDNGPGLTAQWRASIPAACTWLQREAGAEDIVIIGLRLGAFLAALEAGALPQLAGIGLLAPSLSGRNYVRELKALARMMEPPDSAAGSGAGPDGGVDVMGFRLSGETVRDLEALSLTAAETLRGKPVLVLQPKGIAVNKLVALYEGAGAAVEVAPFEGYDGINCEPTVSLVPYAALDTVVNWLGRTAGPKSGAVPAVTPSALTCEAFTDQAVTFGEGGMYAGILCRPSAARQGAHPVIIVNSGMNYHVGWGRIGVEEARFLAEHGIASLRMDFTGIGDSGPDTSLRELPIYDAFAQQSLEDAIAFMRAQGWPKPVLLGVCSGAYTAFHTARTSSDVQGAMCANLQCFKWTPAIGYEVTRWTEARRSEIAGRAADATPAPGQRLKAAVRRQAVRVLGPFVRSARYHAQRSRQIMSGDAREIRSWFSDLSRRRVPVCLVYARGDMGVKELTKFAGDDGRTVTKLPGVHLRFVENSDHNFTYRAARDQLFAHLLWFCTKVTDFNAAL